MKIMQFKGLFFALMFISLFTQASETGIVSGSLDLNVPGEITPYVQFALEEVQIDDSKVIIAQQPYVIAEQPLTSFSVNYKMQQIDPEREYKLVVILATDSKGDSVIGQHEFPVITQGNPNEINVAIDIAPVPIE